MLRRNFSKIGAKNVYYDNELINDIFIVDQIYLENFPGTSDITAQVPGQAGDSYLGTQLQARRGSMRLSVNTMERKYIDAYDAYKQLTDIFSLTEIKKLDFGRFHVFAKISSFSDFEHIGIFMSSTLEFVCYDPFLYYRDIEIPLIQGRNDFFNTSPYEVWPTFEFTGASTYFLLTNNDTGEFISIPSGVTTSSTIRIDTKKARCTINGNYANVDLNVTDFFSLPPGNCSLLVSGGSGTLKYTERRL